MLIKILIISATIVEDTHSVLRKKKGNPEQKHTWNDFTNKIRRSFVFDDKKPEHVSNRNSLITPELALPYDFQADSNFKDKKETRHMKSDFKLEETEFVNKNKETDCNISADTSLVNQPDIQRSISRNDSIGSEVSEKSFDNTGSTQLKLSNSSQNSRSGLKEEKYFDLLDFDSDLGPFQDDPNFKRLAQELKEAYEEIFSYSYDKNGDKDDKNFVRKLVLKVVIR